MTAMPSAPGMSEAFVQIDPLNSLHPIPWNWVLATQAAADPNRGAQMRYYRSQSLISPGGHYAAYSRIQMQVHPNMFQSWVSSVLFLENLRTGDLQAITASSPLADNPFSAEIETAKAGSVAILIPVSWAEQGERLLAREFESILGSDIASDYAVIWNNHLNCSSTVAPNRVHYTNAILLGWSQTYPERVLFQAGNMGEENWSLLAVDESGHTVTAFGDRPLTFGQTTNHVWAGPQAICS